MSNAIKIFENKEFGRVRTVGQDGQVWFVGKDVAEILGYSNPNEALLDHIDKEDKLNSKMLSSFEFDLGQRGGWLINESGLYSLILKSAMPNAKSFRRWVTSEVLPSIRRHGVYAVDELLNDPDTLIKALEALKKERAEKAKLAETVREMKPKALFADAVEASESTILIGELAKILKGNGVEIGQNRLFEKLRQDGYLVKRQGTDYNAPTQRAMELGLFKVKETAVTHADGHVSITKTTKVTGRGQTYFINKFLNEAKIKTA